MSCESAEVAPAKPVTASKRLSAGRKARQHRLGSGERNCPGAPCNRQENRQFRWALQYTFGRSKKRAGDRRHRPKMTRRRGITSAAQERLGGRRSIAGPMSHPGRRGATDAKLVKSRKPTLRLLHSLYGIDHERVGGWQVDASEASAVLLFYRSVSSTLPYFGGSPDRTPCLANHLGPSLTTPGPIRVTAAAMNSLHLLLIPTTHRPSGAIGD